MSFRVFYRQGSFVLADMCSTWDDAVAHARRVQLRRGVWHVRIEDADGLSVRSDDLDLLGRLTDDPARGELDTCQGDTVIWSGPPMVPPRAA
jgi:hypothetical protein